VKLLLLPGLMCDAAVWAPVRPYIEADADLHVPDYSDARSLVAMAERVLETAPARFSLAGHSMGGRVALEIMRRAPHRVERLALLDTGIRARPAGAAGEEEKAKRFTLLAIARERGVRAMATAWVEPMVHPDRLADNELIDAILAMFERHGGEDFAGQIEALLNRPDTTDLLPAIACPTLVLCGRDDGWSTPAQHEDMAGLIPNARLAIVDRCGHMAPMEQPRVVGRAFAAWLRMPAAAEAGLRRGQ